MTIPKQWRTGFLEKTERQYVQNPSTPDIRFMFERKLMDCGCWGLWTLHEFESGAMITTGQVFEGIEEGLKYLDERY